MNQELIDLLRGELEPAERAKLEGRLASDAGLRRELAELESLFALMRSGEEIEPQPETRRALKAVAERATAPSLLQQLKALPGLFRFRFRRSVAFRVAAVSLCVHLIAMAILFQFSVRGPSEDAFGPVSPKWSPDLRPDRSFSARLGLRRLPRSMVLRRVGIAEQEKVIEAGTENLLRSQGADGTFGDTDTTAYAVLVLLAEGDCSAHDTRRGRALRAAMPGLMAAARRGPASGPVLAALVEDWTLSYDSLSEMERVEYVRAILSLIDRLGDRDEASREGLAIAAAAGLPVDESARLGVLASKDPMSLLSNEPTRLAATAVLARGHKSPDLDRLRAWLKPLFERAKAQVVAGKPAPLALLTLQAPYRL